MSVTYASVRFYSLRPVRPRLPVGVANPRKHRFRTTEAEGGRDEWDKSWLLKRMFDDGALWSKCTDVVCGRSFKPVYNTVRYALGEVVKLRVRVPGQKRCSMRVRAEFTDL